MRFAVKSFLQQKVPAFEQPIQNYFYCIGLQQLIQLERFQTRLRCADRGLEKISKGQGGSEQLVVEAPAGITLELRRDTDFLRTQKFFHLSSYLLHRLRKEHCWILCEARLTCAQHRRAHDRRLESDRRVIDHDELRSLDQLIRTQRLTRSDENDVRLFVCSARFDPGGDRLAAGFADA